MDNISVHQPEIESNTTEVSVNDLKVIAYTNVMLRVAQGVSIAQALKEFNIPRMNFFRYAREHPQLITDLVDTQRAGIKVLYTDIALAEKTAIEKYLERVQIMLSSDENIFSLSELEATINYLGNMRSKLEESLGTPREKERDPAAGYLSGLSIKKVIKVTETLSFEEEESSEKVLDGKVSEG